MFLQNQTSTTKHRVTRWSTAKLFSAYDKRANQLVLHQYPMLLTWIYLIPACIYNHIHYKVLDEII